MPMKFSKEYELQIVNFNQIPIALWHDALLLRSAVFVSEQQCIYLDPDEIDKQSEHAFITHNNSLVAYARYFKIEGDGHIGRVITTAIQRGKGYGFIVVNELIKHHKSHSKGPIIISAQAYLHDYYSKLGFQAKGNMYLEDGIPHIAMHWKE